MGGTGITANADNIAIDFGDSTLNTNISAAAAEEADVSETNNTESQEESGRQDLETTIVNTLSSALETSINDITTSLNEISFNGDVNVEYGIFNAQNP